MEEFKLRDEFIRLGQLLKAGGFVESGAMAKEVIADGQVRVNEVVELRRGRKLYDGDEVSFAGSRIAVRR